MGKFRRSLFLEPQTINPLSERRCSLRRARLRGSMLGYQDSSSSRGQKPLSPKDCSMTEQQSRVEGLGSMLQRVCWQSSRDIITYDLLIVLAV